jgi:hypothetical protein
VQTTCAHGTHPHASTTSARPPVVFDLGPLRVAAAAMLAIAAVWPLLPTPDVTTCPLRLVTGIPCPFCGMTRGVVAAVHGDFLGSLVFNPGAVVVLLLGIALLVAWRVRRVAMPVGVVVAWFAVLWAYQLFKYATDRPL